MDKRLRKISYLLTQLPRWLHLKPETVAGKCRLQFGVAIIIILFVALLIPYLWMGKLTDNAVLQTGRSIVDIVLDGHMNRYIRFEKASERIASGTYSEQPVSDEYKQPVSWLRFDDDGKFDAAELNQSQLNRLQQLIADQRRDIAMWRQQHDGKTEDNYIQIIRADEQCLRCHNQQGTAAPFNSKEPIGAMVINLDNKELGHTVLMNKRQRNNSGICDCAKGHTSPDTPA